MRCIRFASRYGWEIEYDTYEGMVRNVSRLEIITKERVKDEFCKMLTCKHPIMAMELLRKIGAMHYVIPELEETYSMTQNEYRFDTVWEHTMAVLEGTKDDNMILRISALLHDIGKISVRTEEDGKVHFLKHELKSGEMIDELLRPLKFSNEIIKEVTFLVRNHMICKTWGSECEYMKDKKLRRLQYECKTEERFRNLMTIIDADNNAYAADKCMPKQVEFILSRTEAMKAEGSAMFGYKLPLTGKEIMDLKGIKPGLAVKECLDYLMKIAFANPLRKKEEFVKHLLGYRLQK